MERGYNEKMIRKQILSAREASGNDHLEKEKQHSTSLIIQIFEMLELSWRNCIYY